MKLIECKGYLEKLIHTMHTPDIKVITGIRRRSMIMQNTAAWLSEA